MQAQKIYQIFWSWLKITLPIFLGLSAIIVLLLVLLTILQVPSFIIGNHNFWLLRWRYEQDANFSIAFNPLYLFCIASIMALAKLYFKHYFQQRRKRRRGN